MDEQVVLQIETGLANRSIAELRAEVKAYKAEVEDATIGSDEWKSATESLAEAQGKLTTATSMENRGLTEMNGSYDALVIQMAKLKKQYHAVTTDFEREALAKQIGEINVQLRDMDEKVGVFGRNVGNYGMTFSEGTSKMAKGVDGLKKGFEVAKGSAEGFKGGLEALSTTPAMAIFGIVMGAVGKLAAALKDSEGGMEALKKAGEAVKPVLNFFGGVLDKIIDYASDLITKAATFLNGNGVFSKLTTALAGVGNAIVNFVAAPFKGVIEAIKVFKADGVKGLGKAAQAFANEMKGGFAFKANYNAGTAVVEAVSKGVKDKKADIEETGAEMGKSLVKGAEEEIRSEADRLADALAQGTALNDAKLAEQKAFNDETLALEKELGLAEVELSDEILTAQEENFDKEQELNAQRIAQREALVSTFQESVGAISSVMSSIADLYEADEESATKNAKKIKALRIASATIETIQGALTAYAQAQSLGPIAGPIMGAINAAAVTAAGIAQIAQIKATDVTGTSSSSSVSSPTVSAPTTSMPEITQTQVVTSASDQTDLNEMLSSQRVELVYSDVQAASRKVEVVQSETTF